KPEFPQRPDAVHAAVVEFYALAYADGSRTYDEDLLPVGDDDIVVLLVGEVIIRRAGLEFAGAGVDEFVYRLDRVFLPELEDRIQRHVEQVGDVRVAEAYLLGPHVEVIVEPCNSGVFHVLCDLHDVLQLADEELVYLRDLDDLIHRDAFLQRLEYGEYALVPRRLQDFQQFVDGVVVEQFQAKLVVELDVEGVDGLEQRFLEG